MRARGRRAGNEKEGEKTHNDDTQVQRAIKDLLSKGPPLIFFDRPAINQTRLTHMRTRPNPLVRSRRTQTKPAVNLGFTR